MIVLNECRIDAEGKCLIVEASVENLDIYKNVYIESVTIDTDKNFSDIGPINNPIVEYEPKEFSKVETPDSDITTEECKCGNIYAASKELPKRVRLIISTKDLDVDSFNNNIFFVWIKAGGVPMPSELCCGMDNEYTLGIAVNLRPIYNTAMQYIKELSSTCNVPRGFIDMILRLKAFELSIKTGNYPVAIKYWNLFKQKGTLPSINKCRCNGIN